MRNTFKFVFTICAVVLLLFMATSDFDTGKKQKGVLIFDQDTNNYHVTENPTKDDFSFSLPEVIPFSEDLGCDHEQGESPMYIKGEHVSTMSNGKDLYIPTITTGEVIFLK